MAGHRVFSCLIPFSAAKSLSRMALTVCISISHAWGLLFLYNFANTSLFKFPFFFFPISSAPFFKIGIQLIYNIVLVSAVQQHESALISSKYTHIPSLLSLPPTSPSHSTPKVIKEHWAELPVLNSSFPLASYFTHDSVYMWMAPSRFSLPSPSPSCPRSFSTPMSLLLPCK